MKTINKHFGKISSVVLLTTILFLNFFGLKLSYFKSFLAFNNILFFTIIIVFFISLYFFYYKSKIFFKITFICVLFCFQAIFISKFINLIEIQNINSSISEKKSAVSLSWVIILPILFILFIILGLIFDYIKSRRTNVL